MLDQYQIQLTQYLEKEQYDEAKQLLRFLLTCQGDERQHAMEWGSLLQWLEQAFPSNDLIDELDKAEDLENEFRKAALGDYGSVSSFEASKKIMDVLKSNEPIGQQLLALERAEFIDADVLDYELKAWLEQRALHPALQFKALQTLKKRGATGTITIVRLGEEVELELDKTPLHLDEYPEPVRNILDKAVLALEGIDVTLPILVTELWVECLQCIYGTRTYYWMLEGTAYIEDCFAAGLHTTIELIVYGHVVDDDIREAYGITDEHRFRYEQISRTIREITLFLQELG